MKNTEEASDKGYFIVQYEGLMCYVFVMQCVSYEIF
jgi:hypothetical protein